MTAFSNAAQLVKSRFKGSLLNVLHGVPDANALSKAKVEIFSGKQRGFDQLTLAQAVDGRGLDDGS